MANFWLDFITKQIPVIVVMGLGLYFISKYFKEEIIRLNGWIRLKDEEIKILNEKILEMSGKIITVSEKVFSALENNTDALHDLKNEIRK